MTAIHERHRNSLLAGILMIFAIIAMVGVIVVLGGLSDTFFASRTTYVVTFHVHDGVKDLTKDSEVRVGGLVKGKVFSVELDEKSLTRTSAGTDEESAESDSVSSGDKKHSIDAIINVTFKLDDDVPLYRNARAYVSSALIGSGSAVEIVSIGGPPSEQTRLKDGQAFTGEVGGSLDQILDNVSDLTGRFNDDYEKHVIPILENAETATVDLKELIAQVSDDYSLRWALSVDRILDNVNSASETLEITMNNAQVFIQNGKDLIANADEGVTEVRDIVQRNEESIDTFVANLKTASADVQELADRLANDTVDKVDALLARGTDALDSFARLGEDLEKEFDQIKPQIHDILASASVAANELSLATTEVRRSPWRLLYRPSVDELEFENLYFAANRFALASTQLKLASESINRVITDHREYLDDHPQELEEMSDRLRTTFEEFEQAKTDLFDILRTGTE